jgi:hypothetical protein
VTLRLKRAPRRVVADGKTLKVESLRGAGYRVEMPARPAAKPLMVRVEE